VKKASFGRLFYGQFTKTVHALAGKMTTRSSNFAAT